MRGCARVIGASEQRVQSTCLLVLAVVAAGFGLRWLAPVLVPFALALFISVGLGLGVNFLVTRLRLPRGPAVFIVLALGLTLLGGVGSLIAASVRQLAADAPVYAAQLEQLSGRVEALWPGQAGMARGELAAEFWKLAAGSVGGLLADTAGSILGILSQSLLVLIFVVFLTLGGEAAGERSAGSLPEVRRRVERYLVAKALISAMTGTLVGVTLALLGVPLALSFGVLACLLNFIPNVGSVVATLLPLPVVIVSPEVTPGAAALAIALPTLIQGVMGNVVEPRMLGDALDLHPVTILLSLILWGMLWGVVGMLLATPISAVLKIFLERFAGGKPLAELLAGRPRALLKQLEAPASNPQQGTRP